MTGFLNIFKGEGVSSTYVVNGIKHLARKALGQKVPCGHMGTLDPLAEGVLPVGVGNATRLFDYFLNKEKTYLARFRFGATTATLDREGEIISGGPVPSIKEIEGALPRLTGDILQTPPAYSAKSVNGRRSYELARQGKEVLLAPKAVMVASFSLRGQISADEFEFEITCGGGTYIRSLARDLAEILGTQGYMTYLCRTKSGPFFKEGAVKLDALTPENFLNYLIPTDSVLPFPALDISDERIYHGVPIPFDGEDGRYKLYRGGEFYGIAAVEGGMLRTEKKLC